MGQFMIFDRYFLVAFAQKLANTFSGTLFFLSGLDSLVEQEDSVMDIALETKWKNSSIELITVSKMRRRLGKGLNVPLPDLIHAFIESHSSPSEESVSCSTYIFVRSAVFKT